MPTLPRNGAFVVLSIDPIATLEDLEDEDIATACKGMVNKKYVAYIGVSYPRLFNPLLRYHTHDCYLVFQGSRLNNLAYCEEPHMVIPILPNTVHPTSRLPISPSLPLPWDNCYISVFASFEARVAVKLTEAGGTHELSPKEMVRLEGIMYDDLDRREELYQADHPGGFPPTMLPARTTQAQEEIPPSREALADDTDTNEWTVPGPVVISDTSPVITCSYDLSTTVAVNSPNDFFEEVEALNRIRAEFNVKKSRKIEEARRIDEDHFNGAKKSGHSKPSKSAESTMKPSKNLRFSRLWKKTKGVA